MTGRHAVLLAPPARRALAELLPPGVAAAAWGLITGALADDPRRPGFIEAHATDQQAAQPADTDK